LIELVAGAAAAAAGHGGIGEPSAVLPPRRQGPAKTATSR